MRVKLNDPVNYHGEITTLNDLIAKRWAIPYFTHRWGPKCTKKYLIDLGDGSGSFEISEKAYYSIDKRYKLLDMKS